VLGVTKRSPSNCNESSMLAAPRHDVVPGDFPRARLDVTPDPRRDGVNFVIGWTPALVHAPHDRRGENLVYRLEMTCGWWKGMRSRWWRSVGQEDGCRSGCRGCSVHRGLLPIATLASPASLESQPDLHVYRATILFKRVRSYCSLRHAHCWRHIEVCDNGNVPTPCAIIRPPRKAVQNGQR
jgi:hypothetical protein